MCIIFQRRYLKYYAHGEDAGKMKISYFSSLRMTKKKAGTRKQSAAIHARGSPTQTPKNPATGTRKRLTSPRASSSLTPEPMLSLALPTPCKE